MTTPSIGGGRGSYQCKRPLPGDILDFAIIKRYGVTCLIARHSPEVRPFWLGVLNITNDYV